MKKLLIFAILLFQVGIFANAQTDENQKKLSRKERKELKKKEAIENKARLLEIVNNKAFVLETHTVFDRYGMSYNMNPTTNFVGLMDETSTVQLGFDHLVGWNGVGGITLDGRVTKFEVDEGKDGQPITVKFRVMGAAMGPASIIITIQSDGNARAYISGDFGERISFQGRFVSTEESIVYKGTPLY